MTEEQYDGLVNVLNELADKLQWTIHISVMEIILVIVVLRFWRNKDAI